MLYKIDNNYYVKVSGHFVKVELVYGNNDVSLKPTDEKIEVNKNIHFEEVNFLSIKEDLLKKHNSRKEVVEEVKHDNKYSNRKYSR